MAKYIERDAFVTWLKKIPMVDLSDGRGLCRVIMEDEFKIAIKNMPESIIHDSEVEVVRCKDCKYQEYCMRRIPFFGRNLILELNIAEYHPLGFCSYGERKPDEA